MARVPMFAFTDKERAGFSEQRAIATDPQGREVLVGLTLEETAFYMAYVRNRVADGQPDPEAEDRYFDLHEKHQRERFRVLGAENELRVENPRRH